MSSAAGSAVAGLGSVRSGAPADAAAVTLFRRALASGRVQVSGGFLLAVVALALLAPVLSLQDPVEMESRARMKPPTRDHVLGTDEFGRDVLTRIVWGARISLVVGAAGIALSTAGGVLLGVLAGYFGGVVDSVVMRLMDIVLCFPPILLGIVVVGFAGRSLVNLVVVLGLLYIPRFARVIYGCVRSVKQNQYVEATRAIGGSHLHVIRKDILPNIFGIVLIQGTLNFGFMILLEAGLSFLGLGTAPPTPSWGGMIAAARDYMELAPLLVVWPSLALALTVLAFNLLGDGLRDALDPRLGEA